MLCVAHTAMGPNGPACPQCANADPGYEDTDEGDIASTRDEYYRPYGGIGDAGYFTPRDSAALGQAGFLASTPQRQRQEYDPMET